MEGPPQEEPEDLEQKPEDTESMSEVQEQNQELAPLFAHHFGLHRELFL